MSSAGFGFGFRPTSTGIGAREAVQPPKNPEWRPRSVGAAGGRSEPLPRSRGRAALAPGAPVRLRNFSQETHLNRAAGTCGQWDVQSSTWSVRLVTGEIRAVKVE